MTTATDISQPFPGMPKPAPLTAPATDPRIPQLKGVIPYHGIPITALGEDGDTFMALGHHPPKAALAAMNSYARHTLDWSDLSDPCLSG